MSAIPEVSEDGTTWEWELAHPLVRDVPDRSIVRLEDGRIGWLHRGPPGKPCVSVSPTLLVQVTTTDRVEMVEYPAGTAVFWLENHEPAWARP